jgi:CrcB protein
MSQYLLVFVGGGIGSALRLGVYKLARLGMPGDFPWGTLAVNVVGSLAAGLVTGWLLARHGAASGNASLFLMTGVLGGFTTFSAFSIDTISLAQRQPGMAAAYVLGTVFLSLGAAALGVWMSRLA